MKNTADFNDRLAQVTARSAEDRPRTTDKTEQERTEGKRFSTWILPGEIDAVQKIQITCLQSGRSSPAISRIIGAAIRELAQRPSSEIIEAINSRPDDRRK
jgi:hypothetical protein